MELIIDCLRFRRLDREVFIAFLAGAIRMLSDEQISVKLLGLESPTSVIPATANLSPEDKFP